jgi:uncharacterized protein (DUF169 family)
MPSTNNWKSLAGELVEALGLTTPPVAITFSSACPSGVPAFDLPLSEPTADGRSGRVAASCVFWSHAAERTFTTVAADHGNCSVGRVVHGFASLADVAGKADVAALFGSGWVTEAAVGGIPVVAETPGYITYGPLGDTGGAPDVVVLHIDGRQLMTLSDALPGLRTESKPQCRIVAVAKEEGEVAVSVGCALSRVRTGMASDEMTCAIPAAKLADVVAAVQRGAAVDAVVAGYAADDAKRFAAVR